MAMNNAGLDEAAEQIADLQAERRALRAATEAQQFAIDDLETLLEETQRDLEGTREEVIYFEDGLGAEEQRLVDFRVAVVEELLSLSDVPLSKLQQSINDIVTAVEGDALI